MVTLVDQFTFLTERQRQEIVRKWARLDLRCSDSEAQCSRFLGHAHGGPGSQVNLCIYTLTSSQSLCDLVSTIMHEQGHAHGFRMVPGHNNPTQYHRDTDPIYRMGNIAQDACEADTAFVDAPLQAVGERSIGASCKLGPAMPVQPLLAERVRVQRRQRLSARAVLLQARHRAQLLLEHFPSGRCCLHAGRPMPLQSVRAELLRMPPRQRLPVRPDLPNAGHRGEQMRSAGRQWRAFAASAVLPGCRVPLEQVRVQQVRVQQRQRLPGWAGVLPAGGVAELVPPGRADARRRLHT